MGHSGAAAYVTVHVVKWWLLDFCGVGEKNNFGVDGWVAAVPRPALSTSQ